MLAGIDAAESAGKVTAEQAAALRDKAAEGPEAVRAALKERLKARGSKMLDRAVEAGRITAEQAEEIGTRVQAGERPIEVIRDMGLGQALRKGG